MTTEQKIPPQNIEAEQAVLAAVLLDGASLDRIVDVIEPDDFYRSSHREIFAAMLRLYERRSAVDMITTTEELRGNSSLEAAGGASYISELYGLAVTTANVEYHAAIVREKALFRKVALASTKTIQRVYEEPVRTTAEELLDHASQAIFDIQSRRGGSSPVPMSKAVSSAYKLIEKRFETKGTIAGIPTGFAEVDRMTQGLRDGDLVIVAGRPSMGKTAFALNVASHAALHHAKKVMVFSLEMSQDDLVVRMIGSESSVEARSLLSGYIAESDWDKLGSAAGKLAATKIFIDDKSALTAMEIRSKARRVKTEHGLDLVIVDYLQLMRGRGDEGTREQEISGISRSLKALAKDLRVPVVALSQLNRSLESRAGRDRRPVMSDLRESGALEQDADVIMFLYREEVYNKCLCPMDCVCGLRGKAEVIIGKQRNGPTGTVDLRFIGRQMRFENVH